MSADMEVFVGSDSEVKKLQDMVKQLEMQNQELRKNSVHNRPYSPGEDEEDLDNVPIIHIEEEYGETEDSWLYESPVKQPTPQQKSQSPYKWCKSNLKPGLVLIRGNLLSKLNSVAFMEEEAELGDNEYGQTESLAVYLDDNSPVRRRSARPITSPKSRPPAWEAEEYAGEIRQRKSFQMMANNKARMSRNTEEYLGDVQPRRLQQSLDHNNDVRYNDMSNNAIRPRRVQNIADNCDERPHRPQTDSFVDAHSRHSSDNDQDEMWPLHMDINMAEVKPRKPLMDYDGDIKPRRSQGDAIDGSPKLRRAHGEADEGDFIRPRGFYDDSRNNESERVAPRPRKSFNNLDDEEGGPVMKRQTKRILPQPQGASLRVSLPAGSGIRPRSTKSPPNNGSPYDSRESLDNDYDDEGEQVVRRRSLPVAPNQPPQSRPASSLSDNAVQHGTYKINRSAVTPRTGSQNRVLPRPGQGVVPRGSKVQPRRQAVEPQGYDDTWQDGCF